MAVFGMRISERESLVEWIAAGSRVFVPADADANELVTAVHTAGRGEIACPSPFAEILIRELPKQAGDRTYNRTWALTAREREILGLIERGRSNKEIAKELGIGISTVKNHVHNILTRLGTHDRRSAVVVGLGRPNVDPMVAAKSAPRVR
jgi:DNA-binding NarL/FixJ family response regulator